MKTARFLLAVFAIPLYALETNPVCDEIQFKKAQAVIWEDLVQFAEDKLDFGKSSTPGYKAACAFVSGHTPDYQPQDGDVIFVGLDSQLYQRVAVSTNSWVSHVGVLMSEKGPRGRTDWYVYESSPLFGHKTPVCDYVGKASKFRFAVGRPDRTLTLSEKATMVDFLKAHYREPYHLGFNFHAEGYQFCSKLVYQAYETIGVKMGSFERLAYLVDGFDEKLASSGKFGPPMTKAEALCFWDSYFGLCRNSGPWVAKMCQFFGGDEPGSINSILPRDRWTVTPQSQFRQTLAGDGFHLAADYRGESR